MDEREPNYAVCQDCWHNGYIDRERPLRCRECGSDALRFFVFPPEGDTSFLYPPERRTVDA